MRCAVKLLAVRIDNASGKRAAIVPAPLTVRQRSHTLAIHAFPQAEAIKHPDSVRTHIDSAADRRQLWRLFIDIDFEACLPQRHRGGEPANSAADDGDLDAHNLSSLESAGHPGLRSDAIQPVADGSLIR